MSTAPTLKLSPPASPARVAAGCFKLLRPGQWIKNGFVLAPLIFAGELANISSVLTAITAALSFCLLSSSVYVLNDWFDREADREHPEKRRRPIASGVVPPWLALSACFLLLAAGLSTAALALNSTVLILEIAYFTINLAYSVYFRNVFILDVFLVASGFVIRVLAGAYAIEVAASHWIILCTFLLAVFLGFGKRRHELLAVTGKPSMHRTTLSSYSPEIITSMNLIICAATIVCFALYTVAPETVAKFGTDRLVYGVPFVMYGLFRYLYLVENRHEGGNPGELLSRDRPLLLCVVLWVVYCACIVARKGAF